MEVGTDGRNRWKKRREVKPVSSQGLSWILSDPDPNPVDGVKGAKQEDVNRERSSGLRNLMAL